MIDINKLQETTKEYKLKLVEKNKLDGESVQLEARKTEIQKMGKELGVEDREQAEMELASIEPEIEALEYQMNKTLEEINA